MSQVLDLCEDSDHNGELPNTASVPPLPLTRKRPRDKVESSNNAHLRHVSGPGDKTTTDSTECAVYMELADEVEVAPHRNGKRRSAMKCEQSIKNDAAGNRAKILQGDHATEQDAASEDSEQTSRDDGFTNTHSQKLSTSKAPSNATGRQSRVSAWEGRLSELAGYRRIHGHCNVPKRYSENSKLGQWVGNQRNTYWVHVKGKPSPMTPSRIQKLESLGFEWNGLGAA
jgi:hypothetical protein